jgi:hypothetical protein
MHAMQQCMQAGSTVGVVLTQWSMNPRCALQPQALLQLQDEGWVVKHLLLL